MSYKIILYALLAAFVLYWLWSVLGRRIGHEETPPAQDPFEKDTNVVSLKTLQKADLSQDMVEEEAHWGDLNLTQDVRKGLALIRAADENFSVIPFISGSKIAFEMVIDSYAQGDKEALRPLLNDEVYRDYCQVIDQRESRGEKNQITILSLHNVEILKAELEKKTAMITLCFSSRQVIKTYDKEGALIDESHSDGEELKDEWVFARTISSRDPNWTVIATRDGEDA